MRHVPLRETPQPPPHRPAWRLRTDGAPGPAVFHPAALPAACHAYRGVPHPEDAYRSRRILLDASHSVHLLTTRHRGGVHGIGWKWPD
ncbi:MULTISPECIES: hypothetical protein [Streptomyces]|uniref:hypothetical protein n=1 Tax=Streptomyces TaxID=1883 RepID=UPI001C8BE31B|nr:hypothetical protein [Streptomyces lateritius]MBX9421449.1 hypothetical protein [Streptomyces lateritius]